MQSLTLAENLFTVFDYGPNLLFNRVQVTLNIY